MTAEERNKQKLKRQQEVMHAIGQGNVTEKSILDRVGDSRYTREILRRLLAQGVVVRVGKGGSNDPFLYTVVQSMVSEDGNIIASSHLVDPGLEVRLKRIETKILSLLSVTKGYTTEKIIRKEVGDNTGTGKALRRLVVSGGVLRAGKGGVGDPFRYCFGSEHPRESVPATARAITVSTAPAQSSAAAAAAKKGAVKLTPKKTDKKGHAAGTEHQGLGGGKTLSRCDSGGGAGRGADANSPTLRGERRHGKRVRGLRDGEEGGDVDYAAETAPFAALMLEGHEAANNQINGSAEEEAGGPDSSTVVAVAPFTPKWARKYRTSNTSNTSNASAGSASETSPSKNGGKSPATAPSAPASAGLGSSGPGRAMGAGGVGDGQGKKRSQGRPVPVGVCVGGDDSMDETQSPVAQATPTLQLKLSAASPNSPQVGGFFGGGYLGANEDHAAVAANVQLAEAGDLSDALGLSTAQGQLDGVDCGNDSSDDRDSSVTSEVSGGDEGIGSGASSSERSTTPDIPSSVYSAASSTAGTEDIKPAVAAPPSKEAKATGGQTSGAAPSRDRLLQALSAALGAEGVPPPEGSEVADSFLA